jgi:hypothetical protein
MTARYLLFPGSVTSRADGDRHHITAHQLAHLYRVPMDECVVMPVQSPQNHRSRMALIDRAQRGELLTLTPRPDGNYTPPARS